MLNFKQLAVALKYSKPMSDTPEARERHTAAWSDAETLASGGMEAPVHARLAALAERFAPAHDFSIAVQAGYAYKNDRVTLHCYLSPGSANFYLKSGSTFEEVLDAVEAELTERTAEFRQKLVRRLALELIERTADFGRCTVAQLRLTAGVSDAYLADIRLSIENEADRLAESGRPFRIEDAAGDNGAPIDEEGDGDDA